MKLTQSSSTFRTTRSKALGLAVTLLLMTAPLTACDNSKAPEEAPASAHSHGNAEETCFICDASKRDAGRMWCKEHARYEDRCWECHPELREPKRAYCEEHHLYEDECHLCGAKPKGTP